MLSAEGDRQFTLSLKWESGTTIIGREDMEELNIGRDKPMNVPAVDIPWNNKDIVSKVLSDTYGSKSFAVYGIDLPPIARYLQTELPLIEATDRISDRLFELEDGSFAIVDYESEYKREKKRKVPDLHLAGIGEIPAGAERFPAAVHCDLYGGRENGGG